MKLLIVMAIFSFGAVHADQFLCEDRQGRQSVVEPDFSDNVAVFGDYVDCARQDQNDQASLEDITFKPRQRLHRNRGFGSQCFSFYCRDCPHGSTTRGYPLLFGYCYR